MIANSPQEIANFDHLRLDGAAKVEELRGLHAPEARWRSGDAEDCKATPNREKSAKVRRNDLQNNSLGYSGRSADCELIRRFCGRIKSPATSPLGPEKLAGGGWYCPCRTVQLIERRPGERGPRYSVWTFFSNRRVDLRYPPIACRSRHHAFVTAYRRLEEVGGQPIVYPASRALDLARSGDVVALECLL